KSQRGGESEKKDLRHAGNRGAVADNQLQNASDIAHENDECEQRGANHAVRKDLPQDVASEDAHLLLPILTESGYCGHLTGSSELQCTTGKSTHDTRAGCRIRTRTGAGH